MLDVRTVNTKDKQSYPSHVDERSFSLATVASRPAIPSTASHLQLSSTTLNSKVEMGDEDSRKANHHSRTPSHPEVPTPRSIYCSPVKVAEPGDDNIPLNGTAKVGPGGDASATKEAEALLSLSDTAV